MIALALFAAAWGPGTVNFNGWPPDRFQKDTTEWVEFVQPRLINKACNDPDPNLEACQWDMNIVLPNPCTYPQTDPYARLACHELAHSPPNNWPTNHPR